MKLTDAKETQRAEYASKRGGADQKYTSTPSPMGSPGLELMAAVGDLKTHATL